MPWTYISYVLVIVHASFTCCGESGSDTSASIVRRWFVMRSHLKSGAKVPNSRWHRIAGITGRHAVDTVRIALSLLVGYRKWKVRCRIAANFPR